MEQLKPFKTYEEQVAHLKETHGLIISDDEWAIGILSKINYYRLSAYGISLRDPANKDQYRPGTSLADMVGLYNFDAYFRTILLLPITEIEGQFRTKVAYHLGKEYGAEGYRDPSNFMPTYNNKTQKTRHQEFLEKLDEEIGRQKNLPCVKHHQDKYGGHFPIWAAIELLSFGNVASLYSIMKPSDQSEIAKEFGTDAYHLHSWMLSLVEVRNICAHANRVYNMPLKQPPKLYAEHSKYGKTNKVFPVILVIMRLLQGQHLWTSFAKTLNKAMGSKYIDIKCLGFPKEWKTVLAISD